MELINKTDANLNIALIAKNKAKSDAQKALMGRVLFMMDNMPTIEAIPKDQYEARLKADLEAMLDELDLEVDELASHFADGRIVYRYQLHNLIQQKIDALKVENKMN